MRGARAAAFVLASCALGSCSLALDGFTDSGDAAPDATREAAIDVAVVDAPNDAADASAPDADAAVDFCMGATFCDQFERADVQGQWESFFASPDASGAITSARARSGASAFRVALPAAGNSGAALRSQLAMSSRVTLTCFLFFDQVPDRDINVCETQYQYGARTNYVYFIVSQGTLQAVELEFVSGTQTYFKSHADTPIITGRWTELVVDVDLANVRATWTYDGTPMATNTPLDRAFAPAQPLLTVGTSYSTAGTAFVFDTDDVRIDLVP
ncbi:MAG TPA: LamG-like jellyroll fold domain-containing protein [Labilithrix sp.]